MYNWPQIVHFHFRYSWKPVNVGHFGQVFHFYPIHYYFFLSSINFSTWQYSFPLSVSLWLSNALNKNSIPFSLPTVLWFLWCSVQHLTHTESKRTSQVLITIPKNGTLILNSENTQKTVLMFVLYNCPKQSEKWIKTYQFNLCALNTLFIISSGLQQTLGPRCSFPLFNFQPKKIQLLF